MLNIRRSIAGLLAAGLFTIASASNALANPFKIIPCATNADGTTFVGCVGPTVTHLSPARYHVAFPAGTWSGCFFVPLVQSVFTASPAQITAWATFGNGSGFVDIAIASGADAPLMMLFTSANC